MKQEIIPTSPLIEWCSTCNAWGSHSTSNHPVETVVEFDDSECGTCGEFGDGIEECSEAKRSCGHHCNCTWIHDECCWCGVKFCDHDCPRSGTVHDCGLDCC